MKNCVKVLSEVDDAVGVVDEETDICQSTCSKRTLRAPLGRGLAHPFGHAHVLLERDAKG